MFKGIVSAGVYVITAIISLFVLKLYFGTFFKLKREIRTYYIWIIYIVWQLLLYGRSGLPAYINLFIGFLLNCSVAIISYSGKLIQKIALAGMLSMLWTLSEFFVGYFFLALGIDYENPMILGAILSEGVVIIIIICLKKFFQHENIKSLPIKHNIALLLIPIGSLFVVYPMFMFNEKRIDGSILCLVIMLFINLITFRLYGVLAEEMEQRRYNSVYTQQLELCNKHNKEKEIAMLEYRNIKHDIKQHYISLLAMLEEEKYTMAKQYLSDLVTGSKEHKTSVCNTENLVVDAIINAKYSVMKLMGIDCEENIHIPTQLPFSNVDISILLGNSIDNAIEAAGKVKKGKNVKIYMVYDKNILLITITNPFVGTLIKDSQGVIKTTKKDKDNHGFGLESIRRVVEKYHGSVVIEDTDNQFVLKVMLVNL